MPLEDLLRALWRRRGRLALLALLLFALGAAPVLSWPRAFVAQAVIAPAETTGIAASALLSPGPLLGSGALLDTRPGGNFAVYLDALRAPEAAAMLARDTDLLAFLGARRAAGPLGALRRALGLRIEADGDDALIWLERGLAATQGVATVTFTLSLAHPDRGAALDALQRLHAHAEAKVRADIGGVAARRIAAIGARLAAEHDVYVRNQLYDLLGQQQRAAVVVAADEAVAARLVSAPTVELRPSVPNRPLLLAMLAAAAPMAALALGACAALLAAAGGTGAAGRGDRRRRQEGRSGGRRGLAALAQPAPAGADAAGERRMSAAAAPPPWRAARPPLSMPNPAFFGAGEVGDPPRSCSVAALPFHRTAWLYLAVYGHAGPGALPGGPSGRRAADGRAVRRVATAVNSARTGPAPPRRGRWCDGV